MMMVHFRPGLPPITITTEDLNRLNAVTKLATRRYPQVAEFLAREIGRAKIVAPHDARPGLVRMGCEVCYRDHESGQLRMVVLVYPEQANIELGHISIVTPVGAALIGLSAGQSIEFKTPKGQDRLLTVLHVAQPDRFGC
jgi:regulator of nucleoside diphosphate kinase